MAWQVPYSMMLHGPDEFYDVNKFYLRQKVEQAAFVLCISDYTRSQAMKVSDPAHWGKLHVIRLGVDLVRFTPNPAVDRRSSVEILCIGRLVPTKGHLILLHSFAHLVKSGYDLRLRLIGDGAGRCTLESFISSEQLETRVILEGALNHEATRQKLSHADIFVLSSFAEGLPVALMEAMAMEIPCISTFVAGIPELIRDGLDGLLVPASSEQALSAALERLISDAELRRRFAIAGRQRVEEFYDLQKNVRSLAATLEDCL
jgi:colanic acid/amylovoran biosynthesis glycosyltransferase